jgi:hypothetical protein
MSGPPNYGHVSNAEQRLVESAREAIEELTVGALLEDVLRRYCLSDYDTLNRIIADEAQRRVDGFLEAPR